jgi:transposase
MIEVETVDVASTIKLLESIEALYPMLALIHVFLDNARYHHAKLVQEWLSRPGRRIKLHFIPPYCPHLNPIERLWGVMHKHVTHNRCYTTCAHFADTTLSFLRENVPRNWEHFYDSVTDNFRISVLQRHKERRLVTNKAGRPAAELAEPRPGTKGNADQHDTHRAQSRVRVTQALDRVRKAARQRKKERNRAALVFAVSSAASPAASCGGDPRVVNERRVPQARRHVPLGRARNESERDSLPIEGPPTTPDLKTPSKRRTRPSDRTVPDKRVAARVRA